MRGQNINMQVGDDKITREYTVQIMSRYPEFISKDKKMELLLVKLQFLTFFILKFDK